MAKKFNGWFLRIISMIIVVFLASTTAFITYGRNAQRLDHHDAALEKKADVALVDLKFDHISERLDVIIKQIAALKKDTRLEK